MHPEPVPTTGPVEQTVDLMRAAAQAMRSVTTSPTDVVRAVHTAVNALQAFEADQLAEIPDGPGRCWSSHVCALHCFCRDSAEHLRVEL